jgi:hypothetical protein
MKDLKEKLGLIKTAYWLGIVADAMWAIALLCPRIFGILTNSSDFNPNLQFRLIMSIGGILMLGWTILLIWAVQKPIERRFVILLTAVVVAGLFITSMIGFLNGNSGNRWILIKCTVLFTIMIISYLKASNIEKARIKEP